MSLTTDCLRDCGHFALDALRAVDANPSEVKFLNKKPYSARIDGAQMELSQTFRRLERFGYIEVRDGEVRVTKTGTETLREWTNQGASA